MSLANEFTNYAGAVYSVAWLKDYCLMEGVEQLSRPELSARTRFESAQSIRYLKVTLPTLKSRDTCVPQSATSRNSVNDKFE